jgi:hypothetical protein
MKQPTRITMLFSSRSYSFHRFTNAYDICTCLSQGSPPALALSSSVSYSTNLGLHAVSFVLYSVRYMLCMSARGRTTGVNIRGHVTCTRENLQTKLTSWIDTRPLGELTLNLLQASRQGPVLCAHCLQLYSCVAQVYFHSTVLSFQSLSAHRSVSSYRCLCHGMANRR